MRGHIRKRGKNSWALVVELPRDPVTQKRRQKWVTVRGTKKEAERVLAELVAQVEGGRYREPAKMTVGEYLEKWLEYARGRLAPSTYRCYKVAVEQHIAPALGGLQLSKLHPLHIQEYLAGDLERGRKDTKKSKPRSLSPTTVAMHYRILRRALKQAVKWDLLDRNPADAVDPPRPVRKEMAVPEEGRMRELLGLLKRTRYHYFIPAMLALATGMRMGEVLGLTWDDVDFERGTAQVRQILYQRTPGQPIFKQPKTPKSRRLVYLPESAVRLLKEHKKRQMEQKLASGGRYNPYNLVCCRPDGQPVNPPTLASAFRALARRAGLEISFHSLRHIHASYLLKQNVHPKVVSERLGHSQISITQDLYSHVMPGLQKEAAEKTEGAVFPQGVPAGK